MWLCRSEQGGCLRENPKTQKSAAAGDPHQEPGPGRCGRGATPRTGRGRSRVEGGKGPLDVGSLETFWSDEEQEPDVGTDLLGGEEAEAEAVSSV